MEINSGTVQIKRLNANEAPTARQLFLLFREVFEAAERTTAGLSYLETLLANPYFIAYAAFDGNQIVGGLTAYILPMYYSERAEAFIYDIAIRPEFQRQGIGNKLLSTLKDYCRQHHIGEMFVAAHEEDTHALEFYRATGGSAEKVVHFTYDTAN